MMGKTFFTLKQNQSEYFNEFLGERENAVEMLQLSYDSKRIKYNLVVCVCLGDKAKLLIKKKRFFLICFC